MTEEVTMEAAALSTLPVFKRTGYGLDLGGTRWRSLATARKGHTGLCAGFESLEELLEEDFLKHGCTPASLVLALPGCYERRGRFEITNLDWPTVTFYELAKRFGVKVEIINDMQAAQIGASHPLAVARRQLTLLKDGKPHPDGHLTVLTLSTGVNWATGRYDNALPLAREQGHVRLAVPVGRMTTEFVEYVGLRLGKPASIENLLSGSQGVDHIVDFLCSKIDLGYSASGKVRQEIAERRQAGEDSASLMTAGVMAENPFWIAVASVYAKLLGYLINQVVVGELVSELVIQGSVLNGTPGFAEWLFKETSIGKILVSDGMEKSHIAREVRIYGVPPDIEMAAIGAERRAYSLLS